MNIKQTRRLMLALIIIGIILILMGVYFVSFTDITTSDGVNGLLIVAGLITAGLFISVPAKIYLAILTLRDGEK